MEKLTIALDWTPNTNHAGLFLAQQQGLYAAAGLDVVLLSPESEAYATTPARRLLAGEADLAVASSETVLSYRTATTPVEVTAVAALLQDDTSAIAVLAASGIERPAHLDGQVYASYQARFEDRIVQQLIRNDGGQGTLRLAYPPKLTIWDSLLTGQVAATWIFQGWEGAQAHLAGVALRTFALGDYSIPYGYTPVLVSTNELLARKKESLTKFLHVTGRGYQLAAADVGAATQLLAQTGLAAFADTAFIGASLTLLQPHFLTESGEWGCMQLGKWQAFVQWLVAQGLLVPTTYTDPEKLFVNL
ncbi:ABC transporter substrate-binding protein [Hymenobacter sp. H14-R3]|uniref:ABC transporter substrate-binding protein n=1 Tax=Hymenobacter sp. H14-R3 TaxID=3046308 RepID=UPI0024B8EC3A|nr:ABC transporter substrate-binding protein [Hymenobacter sp. H14-R3]MDJ0367909.1 ABC transporter substrate-binding protein [Hymenobacter sp. H14-R3]